MSPAPKISVILPVYNVAAWLPETIRSIRAQTFPEWEAIFVIDGSPDNSVELVREAQLEDPRILLVEQPNRGQGAARDKGVELARGEYFFFLDPDDLVPPDALKVAYESAVKHDADIVLGDYVMFWDHEKVAPVPAAASEEFRGYFGALPPVFRRGDLPDDGLFYHSLYFMVVWMKLFKAATWRTHDVRAPEGLTMGEDFMTVKRMCFMAERICLTDHVLVYYRKRQGSATTKRSRKAFGIFDSYRFTRKMYEELKLSRRENTLMHAAFLKWFYSHLVVFSSLRDWPEFYRCIHEMVSSFDRRSLDFSLLDGPTRRALLVLRWGSPLALPFYLVSMVQPKHLVKAGIVQGIRGFGALIGAGARGKLIARLEARKVRSGSGFERSVLQRVIRHLGSGA